MTTLEDVENSLQLAIDSLEKTMGLYVRLEKSYENLMKDARATEVAVLRRPHLLSYIQEPELQRQVLLALKFHAECNIEDARRQLKKIERKGVMI